MWILKGCIKYECSINMGVFNSLELAEQAQAYAKYLELDFEYFDIEEFTLNVFDAGDGETDLKQF